MITRVSVVSLLLTWALTLESPLVMAQGGGLLGGEASLEYADTAYRPSRLEAFNEKMFGFNLWLDEHILRPVAAVYDRTLPDPAQRGLKRFFRNLGVVPRVANSLFQLKLWGAGREVSRFVINTTLGGVGFFDVAGSWFELRESNEDFGQTLGHYGIGSGPYLVLPFFGPSTVRDALGVAVDGAMDPKNYLLPSSTERFVAETGGNAVRIVNERSLNLELFEDVDRFAIDLYSAVQDFYLQRRAKEVRE